MWCVERQEDKVYVKNVVICDSQKQYSENLFQVLTKSKSPEVQFYLFHSMQDAEQFAKEKKIYALLTGEEYPKEKRRQIPAVRRFVLVQDKRVLCCMHNMLTRMNRNV